VLPWFNQFSYSISHLQELVGSKNNGKFKKGLIIAIVLIVVIGLSIAAVYYLNQKHNDSSHTNGAPIQLNDYLENKLYARKNNATWLSSNELTYRDLDVSYGYQFILDNKHFVYYIVYNKNVI
jgi:cbb3-type cytochrome oxidase subunit 3